MIKILNREFQHPADGWYQIEPKGEHPNHATGLMQIIDDEAMDSIVNRFNADARAGKLHHGSEMLIDHEHFSDQMDKETRAYGWLQELQNREDGIYARIRWTTTGKKAVDGGDYRFFSTEYVPQDLKLLNDGKPKRVRPLRLDGLTLTNMHNNRGQKPITNRNQFPRGAGAPASDEQTKTERTKMKSVCIELGLSADAFEENVLAEVRKLMNRAKTAEGELAPVKNRITELETSNTALLADQVEALLDAHGVKEEKVRNRMKVVLGGLNNREERMAALTDLGFKPVEAQPAKPAPRVLNRGTGAAAAEPAASTDDESAKVEKIRNRCTELRKGGLSFDAAWAMAAAETK